MPEPTAGSAGPVGTARTLAQVYRHFGEVVAAGTSPLYARVAVALSESDEALRAIEAVPARKRHPTVVLAALHDLALVGAVLIVAGVLVSELRPRSRRQRVVPGPTASPSAVSPGQPRP